MWTPLALTDKPAFSIEGSFYGAAQQEVGGRFTMKRDTDNGTDNFDLTGAFGADRRGN